MKRLGSILALIALTLAIVATGLPVAQTAEASGEPPRQLKIQAITMLEDLDVSVCCNPCVEKNVNDAIDLIRRSLDDSLWIDDHHVNPDCLVGADVFDLEEKAVVKLDKAKIKCPEIKAEINEIINLLVIADMNLAYNAIGMAKYELDNADCASRIEKKLAKAHIKKAERRMNMGLKLWDKTLPAMAMEKFEHAWIHAQLAIKILD